MRLWIAALVSLIMSIGCSTVSEPSGADPSKNAATKDSPLREAFVSGVEATEWLLNTKHTLNGTSLEVSGKLVQDLLDLGATEIRLDGIVPDPADPTFKSASRMIVKAPTDPEKRSAILSLAAQWNGEVEPPDTLAEYAEIRFPMRR